MSAALHHSQGDHEYVRPAVGTPSSSLDERFARAFLRRVEAKEVLFAEGDPASQMYRVETGAVVLYRVLTDGRRQVLGFAYPGDLIGLGVDREHWMNAQAIKPTRVRCISAASMRQAAGKDPILALKLYEAVAKELTAARELMLTTGQRSAIERVSSFLIALSRRNEHDGDEPGSFALPMTRTDIGDFLGLTIETVSRTFTKLRLLGLIQLQSHCRVRVTDLDALGQLAADGGRIG